MMRLSLSLLALTASTMAFTSAPMAGRPMVGRFMSAVVEEEQVAAEAAVEETPVVKASTPTSGLSMKEVRNIIGDISADNFDSSLSTLEPYLLNEAGCTMYAKSMRRLSRQAKVLGKELPSSFALEAKATAVRRGKQDAFIKAKEEEKAAAAAEETEEETPEEPAEE